MIPLSQSLVLSAILFSIGAAGVVTTIGSGAGVFMPIGFELFGMLRERFVPVDIIAVVRHNQKLQRGNWNKAAEEGNFFLRGFNYLFIMRKPQPAATARPKKKGGAKPKPWFKYRKPKA